MRELYQLLFCLLLTINFQIDVIGQCAGPSEIIPYRIQADNIQLIWDAGDPTSYTVELGASGFVQGSGTYASTTDTIRMISGLTPKTLYDFYLYSTCSNGMIDSIGPLTIETILFDDIGITFMDAPLTGCDLTNMEDITISITNFGQNPHQLFDFSYSIEDIEGNISRPFDGVYTGIVGFDSTVLTTFDVKADVGFPGEYKFRVWTALVDDQDMTNDTFEIVVTHQPVIDVYPYEWNFEEWKGGWLIDESASENSSFEYGRPNSPEILSAASGSKAWVTNLIGDYNANERSVLISPCFDFSSMTVDPYMSFALNFEGEACCDFAYAEISINAGRNWTKIGDGENGINWYNNNDLNRWDGKGINQGWSRVQNRLFGAAGRDSVRIRYIFESDQSTQGSGIGIDDIYIYEPYTIDAAIAVVDHTSTIECGATDDKVLVALENTGLNDISSFIISYSLNGGAAVSETINQLLVPEDRDTFELTTPINTAADDSYHLVAWVAAPGDLNLNNDTLFTDFEISGVKPLPLIEDFEGADLPIGWATANGAIGIAHSSLSSVFYAQLNTTNNTFELNAPNVGPISAMDSLQFEYRIVDAPNGTVATNFGVGNSLAVEISTDCGMSYSTLSTIDNSNHIPSTQMSIQKIDMTPFVGMDVKIRFVGLHVSGNYFIDLDNINIDGCPTSLALTAMQNDASSGTSSDGSISVVPNQGTSSYMYSWTTGATTATITNLAPADYTVTVIDSKGCQDQLTISLGSCDGLGLTINKTNESPSGNDGTAMVQPNSGVAPYTYQWETGVTTDMIWDLGTGTYSVTVTDANGCTESIEAVIDLETATSTIPDLHRLLIYPNPVKDELSIELDLDIMNRANVQLYNALGELVYRQENAASRSHAFQMDASGLLSGIYFVRIEVGRDMLTRKIIVAE